MIIKIVVVGRTKEASLRSLEKLYLERLARYSRIDLVSVRGEKLLKGQKIASALKTESQRILREIDKKDFCIVLDSRGQQLTSPELASILNQQLLSATGRMVFVAGGPLGLADSVRDRADLLLSFSQLTFTHEMIRVLLVEQLYRVWTILRGEKYHK